MIKWFSKLHTFVFKVFSFYSKSKKMTFYVFKFKPPKFEYLVKIAVFSIKLRFDTQDQSTLACQIFSLDHEVNGMVVRALPMFEDLRFLASQM